jgi:dolichol-phosphate mannosyltransferase
MSKTELTIVIPTYNERDNIVPLIEKVDQALTGVTWNIFFVDDDSTDGTLDTIREVITNDVRIQLLHRIGRKGLSSACIEGMSACSSPYLAVMDADLQHDESLLKLMLVTLKNDKLDIVVGSRYVAGGSFGDWTLARKIVSKSATAMSKLISRHDLKDAMSGFFMLQKSFFDETKNNLNGGGFKILLDLFASSNREIKFKELPFTFRTRTAGESKLGANVMWDYLKLIVDKKFKKRS